MSELALSKDVLDELRKRYLLFYIGKTRYGISLDYVLEIIHIQNVTAVPSVPLHIKGIINLRGKIVPIVDVRLKLGIEERAYDDKTCIIVVSICDSQIGMIVDSVFEVINAETKQLSAPPHIGDFENDYLSSVIETEDGITLNIDCEKFFRGDIES